MEETIMGNIEIRDFPSVQVASDMDYVVLSLSGGSSAKYAVGLMKSSVSSDIAPSIREGVWWIGAESTGIQAEGKTPEFRRGELGVEYKYVTESPESWRLLVAFNDISIDFDNLTDEQRDLIRMKFEDLEPEDIAELQKPANDMIAILNNTNGDILLAESVRASEFASLKAECISASEDARDTADHPTYIGTDNYVYKWDKTAQAYGKTAIYVRGEAFSIKKVYVSIDAMLADKTTSFKEGDFCLINTGDVENPDNAKLYVRSAVGSWDFLVDMSGAIGFTGKTPQMFVGAVLVGAGKSSASVTLSSDGTDEDGNPKYRINYTIPCLAYEDLTEEQILELQRPANEMISLLQSTNNSIVEAEKERAASEMKREDAERERTLSESERDGNEKEREENEQERISSENVRIANEELRNSKETERSESEENRRKDYEAVRNGALSATENANAAASETRNLPKIQNGTWWLYNVETKEYEDSGVAVNTAFDLTKEKIERVFTGDIGTHTHEHLRYVAQVYDGSPDLSQLTTYMDGMGEHPFLPGNDIYVANSDEPTGYANYKLAVTSQGNVWVRVAQVPEGYRIVLAKGD